MTVLRLLIALLALALAVPAGAYEVRPSRIYRLATVTKPADNVQEDGITSSRYYRAQPEHQGPGLVRVQWLLHDGTSGPVPPSKMPADIGAMRVRCLVDNVPISDWMPGPGTCDMTAISPPLPDGHHGLSLEIDWPFHTDTKVSAVLFTSGPPKGAGVAQPLAICPNGYDYAYASVRSDKCAQVDWPGHAPVVDVEPWNRVSAAKPYTTWPTDTTTFRNSWWVECVGMCTHRMLIRRPIEMSANRDGQGTVGTGRMGTGTVQQYYYEDSTADGKSTLTPTGSRHRVPQIDGPRGIGTVGSVIAIRLWDGDSWVLSSGGRLAKLQLRGPGAGAVTTTFGLRVKPGSPAPYWGEYLTGMHEAHYEHLGVWAGPHVKPPTTHDQMVEPWDFAILDKIHGQGAHHFLVTNTKSGLSATGGSIVYVDHTPVHATPPGPPVARDVVVFGPGQCDWPWGIDQHPTDGWWYVTCQLSGNIVRIRPVIADQWAGAWEWQEVWRTAKNVTREALGVDTGCRGCNHRATLMTATQIRAAYHVDGPFGVASLVHPQAIRFDSQGHAIVCGRYGYSCADLDLTAKTLKTLFVLKVYWEPGGGDWRDVQIDVASHGGAGPKDLIRITGWAQAVSQVWTRQGQYMSLLWPDAPTRVLTEGQYAGIDQIQYPWAIASNADGEEIVCGTGDQQACFVRRRVLPTDVPIDTGRYARGFDVWLKGGTGNPKHPSFALTHGQHGYSEFGLPTVDTMGRMNDEELGAFLRAGAGSKEPRPDLVGQPLADLIYWIRATAKTKPPVTPPPPTTYALVLQAGDGGSVSGGGLYPAGAVPPIAAQPDDGWEFSAWSAPCNATPFSMPAAATTCVASFAEMPPFVITCGPDGICRTSRKPPFAFTATCPPRLPDGSSCVMDTTP